MKVQSAKELIVYQKAYQLAMDTFDHSKNFPSDKSNSALLKIHQHEPSGSLG